MHSTLRLILIPNRAVCRFRGQKFQGFFIEFFCFVKKPLGLRVKVTLVGIRILGTVLLNDNTRALLYR